MNTEQILRKLKELENEMKDYETALIALRGKNSYDWELNIEEDKRSAVKVLYQQYLDAAKAYNNFKNKSWKEN